MEELLHNRCMEEQDNSHTNINTDLLSDAKVDPTIFVKVDKNVNRFIKTTVYLQVQL